jgi:tetratricopeptide (TPR) repeat protein
MNNQYLITFLTHMRFHRVYIVLMLSIVGWFFQKLSVGYTAQSKCTINNSWEKTQLLYSPRTDTTPIPPGISEQREGAALNDLSQIELSLRQAIQAKPEDAENYLKLIRILSDKKQEGKVILIAQQWIQAMPNSGRLPYWILGDTLRDQNQIDEAIAVYQKATLIRSSERENSSWYDYLTPAHFHVRAGDLFLFQGKQAEAISAYKLGAQQQVSSTIAIGSIFDKENYKNKYTQNQNMPQAEETYREIIKLVPKSAFGYYRLIQILVQAKRFDEAIWVYRQWIPQRPNPPIQDDLSFNQPSSYLAELMERKAIFLRALGNLDEGIKTYRLLLKEFPSYSVSGDLPDMLVEQGDLEGAAGIYRQRIQKDPVFGFSYLQLGSVLVCQGKIDEAIVAYEQAARTAEKSPASHFLGNLLLGKGKLEAAAKAYHTVLLEHNLSSSGGWLPEAVLQRYDSLLKQKKWRDAITLYNELLQMKEPR